MSFIQVENMTKIYKSGQTTIKANDSISFTIDQGEFVTIVGPSGAGKSTLLNIIGGMEKPDQGRVIIDGKDISQYGETDLTTYRRDEVGFVFQFYNLVPNLTALENVELAAEISKDPFDPKEVLEAVGLGHRLNNFPSQLSGGEQQRTAIARAIAKNPKLLLCDEPTGALDYETGKEILKILYATIKDYVSAVLLITHNQAIVPMGDKNIEIANSKVRDIQINPKPVPVEDIEW